jgi:hypothetical protein
MRIINMLCYKIFIIQNINILQLLNFNERIGQNKIGFYCRNLFIINHFRFLEVSFILL